ncbi:HAD-superfamily hydrolase, subfamily IA, variant 1 [Sarocladium strictum]
MQQISEANVEMKSAHESLQLRAIILGKSWIGFDLDDTLHEFRRASATATNAVLSEIATQYDTSQSVLGDAYHRILKLGTANAFSEGKTSFEYRRERFGRLLSDFSLAYSEPFMCELLDMYETTLLAQLELKDGAEELLSTLKKLGKKIVVITEGPQDAQQRTVEALGISSYIDYLATTNHFKVPKTNGLFPQVLSYMGVSPPDIAYIGDSSERDMEPAMAEGIFAIHLAEGCQMEFGEVPVRMNSLRTLHEILSES